MAKKFVRPVSVKRFRQYKRTASKDRRASDYWQKSWLRYRRVRAIA